MDVADRTGVHTLTGMAATMTPSDSQALHGDWQRVGEVLRQRTEQLGWSIQTLTGRAGVSRRTIDDLLAVVRDNYTDDTLAAVEDAVDWPRGSIREVAEGGDIPTPLTEQRLKRIDRVSQLLEEVQHRLAELERRLDEQGDPGR